MRDLRRLYDDPAVVMAMDVLKRHGVTGAQFELWCETRDHASLGFSRTSADDESDDECCGVCCGTCPGCPA